MKEITLSFHDWLLKFKGVDLPIGDLENDVEFDNDFPKKSKDYDEILNYLELAGAEYPAIETFKECFEFYSKSHLSSYGSEE